MKITMEVIPHNDQRYETVGDWTVDISNRNINIKVSELDNWKMEFLIAFHELIEVILCLDRGIKTEDVDKFDMAYENTRSVGDKTEPGDHPDAPYRKEHFFAMSLERLMAAELGVDWQKYEEEIDKLGE